MVASFAFGTAIDCNKKRIAVILKAAPKQKSIWKNAEDTRTAALKEPTAITTAYLAKDNFAIKENNLAKHV